jgi:hypothetical protein
MSEGRTDLRVNGGRIKEILRVCGILILVLGVMCVPVGWGVNPQRDLSAFLNLADMGAFLTYAVIGIAIGLILLAASAVAPRGRD